LAPGIICHIILQQDRANRFRPTLPTLLSCYQVPVQNYIFKNARKGIRGIECRKFDNTNLSLIFKIDRRIAMIFLKEGSHIVKCDQLKSEMLQHAAVQKLILTARILANQLIPFYIGNPSFKKS
jgi:hypothetical protein